MNFCGFLFTPAFLGRGFIGGDYHYLGARLLATCHNADCNRDLIKSGGNHTLQGGTPHSEGTQFFVSFFWGNQLAFSSLVNHINHDYFVKANQAS